MSTLRVAFFNVENLFARSNLLNPAAGSFDPTQLDRISALRKELARDSYTGREQSIVNLYHKVQNYLDVIEERESLFRRGPRGEILGLRASGRHDWDGSLRLRDAPLSAHNRLHTARVIKEINADVVGLAEVESRRVLERFNRDLLDNRYPYAMLLDGNDERGIDVGVLSRVPFTSLRTHIFDEHAGRRIFQRDCLEVSVETPRGAPLILLLSHFKSRRKSKPGELDSDAMRKLEAQRVAEILRRYDLERQQVLFMGDLNDTRHSGSSALEPLWQVAHSAELFERLHQGDDWTFYYAPERQRQKIDFMFASTPLLQRAQRVGIERRGIWDLATITGGRERSFETITRPEEAASDHAALWAEFDFS